MASAIFRCNSPRSDCLYSSSQLKPSHFRPSKMELTDASVLRSTSVSSSRKIMVPAFRRAYSQLKMNVRALPTWRNPVGEGAKRTLALPCEGEFKDSGIGSDRVRRIALITPANARVPKTAEFSIAYVPMVRAGQKHGQAGSFNDLAQPFDLERYRRWALYLKPIVF